MGQAVTITRRSVLGLALLAAAGCRQKAAPRPAPTTTPDAAALATARASELAILSAYDAAIATSDGVAASRLTAERAFHAQHLIALHGSSTGVAEAGNIRSLLRGSADALHGAAVAAADGGNAALFASIAASHLVSSHE